MPIIACFEGRLVADPDLTYTPNTQTPVTEARVLCNRRTRHDDTWTDAEPTGYHIKAWRHRAEALATLTKGDSIVIIGHVETETWTTDNNEKRYRDTVIIDALGTTTRT